MPEHDKIPVRRKPQPDNVDALMCAISFIYWANEDKAMYGGYNAEQALDAISTLTGFTRETIEKIANGT